MKRIFSTLILAVVLSCCVNSFAAAGDSKQLNNVDDQVPTMQLRVARGYTIIEDIRSTLFIDYSRGLLYNLTKGTGRCEHFEISPVEGDDFIAAQMGIFSELKIVQDSPTKSGDSLAAYRVTNAPRAMMLRGVASAQITSYGIDFIPSITEYMVDTNHVDFLTLQEIGQYNATKFATSPLLRQLDITCLLTDFGGVPVQKTVHKQRVQLDFIAEKEEILRALLPAHCL